MNQATDGCLRRALDLHHQAVVIDTHCDTTQRLLMDGWDFSERHEFGHVDLPRLREGGVAAVFLAVYAASGADPAALAASARRQIEAIEAAARAHANDVTLARSAAQVRAAKAAGRTALLIGVEGGHLIGDSLETLEEFHRRGAIYLTLTHAAHTSWADSAGVHESPPPRHGGLTAFGREVIGQLNRLGMVVDVSHVSDATLRDALETSTAPVMASHSSCRSVSPHRRNLSDDLIRAVADRGGTVQINFAAPFIDPAFPALDPDEVERWWTEWWSGGGRVQPQLPFYGTPLARLVDHFDHALQLVGPDHVGVGSDFDGVLFLPEGMEDCSKLPALTAALLQRGYSERDLAKVLGANVLRVMEACQAAALVPSI
jgi:membrane dipeptidase